VIRWLLRLVGWPRASGFRYETGAGRAFADPIAAYRRLWIECGGSPQDLLASSESPDARLSMPATDRLLAAVRRTFALVPFDSETGRGADDEHVYAVLDGFCDYLDQKKKTPAS
jgi:hypothetical protein